jgi:acyl-CoA dehydrogenase
MKSIYTNEDHDLFRESVRRFVEAEVAPHADEWEAAGRIPREIFVRMGDLGFLGILFPEAYGGAAGDVFHAAAFCEEITRSRMGGFCAAVTVQQFMATQHIFRAGSEELRLRYLAPSIAGRKVGALAVTEPDTGSDVASIRTSAVRDGGAWVVNGAKTWITNGADGDFYTVAVKTARDAGTGGISLVVVDADTPGVTVGKRLKKLGLHASDTAELVFEDVRVPATNLVGHENMGFYHIMEAFQLERLVGAFLAIGSSDVCIEETLAYMAGRRAFGRTLDRFQVLRHRIAQLSAELEAARQLVYHTAWLHDRGEQAIKESSMAKLVSTELSKRIADECLQCFGGFGYSEEYPMARFFRDSRAGTILAGTSEIMREIIARFVVDGEAPPRAEVREPAHAPEAAPPPGAEADTKPARPAHPDAVPLAVDALMQSLPGRLRPDAAKGWTSRFHFKIAGSAHPEWTVVVDQGECTVDEGLAGEPQCVVEMEESTFLCLEEGTVDAQMAFLSGKVRVSNLAAMMRYAKAFRRARVR